MSDLSNPEKLLKHHWSRVPGKFVNQKTGEEFPTPEPVYVYIQEWYMTLVHVIQDVEKQLGKSCDLYVSPEVATLLEHIVSYRAVFEEEALDDYDPSEYKTIGKLSDHFMVMR